MPRNSTQRVPASGVWGEARGRILVELCGHPQTAAELATRVGTSGNAVRVHLDGLRDAGLVDYTVAGVVPDMSFVEMLDVLNEQLVAKGEDTVSFDSDCREGICGSCVSGVLDGIQGIPHAPWWIKLTPEIIARLRKPTRRSWSRHSAS